jgi:hypothetical protein
VSRADEADLVIGAAPPLPRLGVDRLAGRSRAKADIAELTDHFRRGREPAQRASVTETPPICPLASSVDVVAAVVLKLTITVRAAGASGYQSPHVSGTEVQAPTRRRRRVVSAARGCSHGSTVTG